MPEPGQQDDVAARLAGVRESIAAATAAAGRPPGCVTLIAVSKSQPAAGIELALAAGQRVFGENYVQEAQGRWPTLRERWRGLELHLIGGLQSNKAADAVALFDVIQTVDREKLARALAKEIARQGRSPRLMVQVNTGDELQKSGIAPAKLHFPPPFANPPNPGGRHCPRLPHPQTGGCVPSHDSDCAPFTIGCSGAQRFSGENCFAICAAVGRRTRDERPSAAIRA